MSAIFPFINTFISLNAEGRDRSSTLDFTCCLLLNKWLHHNNYIKRDGDMVNDVHYLHWFLLESDINVVITIMVAININIGNIMRLWSEPSLSGDSIIRYQCCLSLFSILRNVDNVMKDNKSHLYFITHLMRSLNYSEIWCLS